jgi:predicted HicB family RNase H-like nuclease
MKQAITFPDTENRPLEHQRHQSFPLRLPPSIWSQIRLLAGREGISLNQFISQAIGEKMARLKPGTHAQ